MFGKLIKHELRATGRIMLPLMAVVLALSPLAGFSLNRFVNMSSLIKTLGTIVTVAFFVATGAVCLVSFILMIRRFYTNLLGDEGYLTFTLPVSTSAIIFSKLIVSFVWFAAAILTCIVAGGIIAEISYAGFDFSQVADILGELSKLLGWGNIVCYCLEGLVCAFLFSCFTCMHFYAAMALGHSFTNHKIFLSVCFYILLSIAMFILFVVIMKFADGDLFQSIGQWVDTWMDNVKNEKEYALIPHAIFGGTAVYFALCSALYYIPTVIPLNKRLNLN